MKKIQLYRFVLLAALPAMLLTACRFEEDDDFDETASLRVEHAIEKVQDILVSAPQGWVMQYYANTGDSGFEGFNLFAKFEKNGKVTLAGNHRMLRDGNANKYTEATSVYELLLEDGPVLAFNTWNDVLTVFVDPVDPASAPGSLVKDGAGMAGDHNFVIMSYNDNEVILRGERYGAEVRLVKAESSWEDYIAETQKMKDYITNTSISNYYLTNGTDTLYMLSPRSGHFRIGERINDPLRAHWASCCYTPTGFRMEYQDTIGANKFQELTLAEDKTCLQNEDGTVKVIACWDQYISTFGSIWKFDPISFNSELQSLYDDIDAELKKANASMKLVSVGLGAGGLNKNKTVKGLVINYSYTSRNRTVTAVAAVELSMVRLAYGRLQLGYSSENVADNNIANFKSLNANDVEGKVRALAEALNSTYEMIPDNYFKPGRVTLTSANGKVVEIFK